MEKYIKNILIKRISLFFDINITKEYSLELMREGRNNDLYKFQYKNLNLIIKKYPKRKLLNFKREKLFYEYLSKMNIKNVPEYFFSIKKKLSVFSYLSGKKSNKIDNDNIKNSLRFIEKINSKNVGNKFEFASDGCSSVYDHIQIVSKRIDNFNDLVEKNFKNKKIYFFLKRKLNPRFNFEKKLVLQNYKKQVKNKFKKNELILSPSDFGFHNMLIKNKKTFFFDFEYSGMDDASKLFCDYICQPDLQLNEKQIDLLLKKINIKNKNNLKIKKRIKLLLNIHRIKWCMVMLNIFLIKKKLNMNLKSNLKNLQNSQLNKSINYFNRYL